ncbi:MAG: hypothetical protein H7Z77_05260 [Chitinophagaceae bacterium]|nr:hypothetical protein [Polaromonas sp.]
MRWLEGVEAALEDAVQWCDAQVVGLPEQLLAAVTARFTLIERFSMAWHRAAKDIRCHRLNRFIYSLIYTTAKKGGCVIVAFAHQQRKPMYWRNRLNAF